MFFKNKKIRLNCYTSEQYIYEYFKIDYANKFLPAWWKNLEKSYVRPNNIGPTATMKTCLGFTKYYQNGVIIPLWSDLIMRVNTIEQGSYGWEFSDGTTEMNMHSSLQRGDYLSDQEYIHMKIVSPWVLVCEEDIDWMFIKPDWNFTKPEEIIIPPSILEFKYQHTNHINFFLKFQKQSQEILIESGSPVIHLIPLSERRIELNVQKISPEQMQDYRSKTKKISFLNKYNKIKKIVKTKDDTKCPFRF